MSKTNVILFPRHKFHRCECGEPGCMYCEGGLCYCTTCGGGEGSLTEDCPQVRMTEEQERLVYEGVVDFRRKLGGWTSWTRAKEMVARGQLL